MRRLIINEEELRVAMARAGIYSMAELARKAELHTNTLYSLTDTSKAFSSTTVDRIASALHCDPLALLETAESTGASDTHVAALIGATEKHMMVAA